MPRPQRCIHHCQKITQQNSHCKMRKWAPSLRVHEASRFASGPVAIPETHSCWNRVSQVLWKWQWRVCVLHCWLMWTKTAYPAVPCPSKVWKTDFHLWMMRLLTDRATRDQDGMTETSPTIAWSDSRRVIYAGKDLQEHHVQPPTRPTKPHHWTMSLSAASTRLLTAFRGGEPTTLCMKQFFPLPSLNLPWSAVFSR